MLKANMKPKKKRPFEGTVPMICPDCDMAYYRTPDCKDDGCDFCAGDNIQVTTHQHIVQLVEDTLLLDSNYYTIKHGNSDIAEVSA